MSLEEIEPEGEAPEEEDLPEPVSEEGDLSPETSAEVVAPDPSSAAEVDDAPAAEGEDGLPAAPGEEAPPGEAGEAPIIKISREELQGGIEALLFATGEPITVRQLADLFQASVHDVREAIEELRLEYVNSRRAFRIEDIAGGIQVLTLPRYEAWIRRYLSRERDARLSPAAFETLAVIAYKQPINKADLEAIRGVQCGPILKTLMDRNLVKVVGREETLGKPLLYGTTKRFLESFGLSSIAGLPQPELEAPPPAPAPEPRNN